MKPTNLKRALVICFSGAAVCAGIAGALAGPQNGRSENMLTGPAAFASIATEKPGTFRKITAADLPAPFATPSAANQSHIVPRPANASLQVPPGFEIQLFATGFEQARELRTAPSGDIFLADSAAGEVNVLHGMKVGKPDSVTVLERGIVSAFVLDVQ